MIHGFDTRDEAAATAALLVYATWRSRDRRRFTVTPDVWGQVERFVKASAKRASSLPRFLEALKPRLCCASLSPGAMRVGLAGEIPMEVYRDRETGALAYMIQRGPRGDEREFMVRVVEGADARAVLGHLFRETAWVILLVRDRLERERGSTDAIERHVDALDLLPETTDAA